MDVKHLIPEQWPTFTDEQVSFLERIYPARCIAAAEPLELHLRYAGKVDLIAQLRSRVLDAPKKLDLTEEELDELAMSEAGVRSPNEEEQQ